MEILGTAVAIYLLLAVAMPNRFIPGFLFKEKKKKMGANMWGVYEGCATDVPEDQKRIVAPPRPTGPLKIVAGSAMYANGKGISFKR